MEFLPTASDHEALDYRPPERQTAPVVTRLDNNWGNVALLCSDGITNHVTDERIRDVLR